MHKYFNSVKIRLWIDLPKKMKLTEDWNSFAINMSRQNFHEHQKSQIVAETDYGPLSVSVSFPFLDQLSVAFLVLMEGGTNIPFICKAYTTITKN